MKVNKCGTVGGMRFGKGDRSTWGKSASMQRCPPQILPDLGSVMILGRTVEEYKESTVSCRNHVCPLAELEIRESA
jgi:hypothetical protein